MKATYLILDLLTLLPTLLFSFHPRIAFFAHARTFLPALAVSAAVFITWDAFFTRLGVWGFNPEYITGSHIGNLPVEEYLFFICIPYACVFTAFSRRLAGGRGLTKPLVKGITGGLIGVLVVLACLDLHRRYTATTFLSLSLMLAYACFILKAGWLGRFYVSWFILLLPLIIVDGILTGTGLHAPVVWYNPRDILGVHILTIPVEDFFYGMELILLNVVLCYLLQRLRPARTARTQIHEFV